MVKKRYTLDEERQWYNSLPSKRASAAMVIRHRDSVLMVKATYKDYWTFPGGVVDESESPYDAAIRETNEEVGLVVAPEDAKFLAVSYVAPHYGFMDRLHFFFMTTVEGKGELNLREGEIEEARWVPFDKITKLSDRRPSYGKIQDILISGEPVSYFELF